MRTNGRFEARALLRVAVLVRGRSRRSLPDLALTDNVSARGARIITKRSRRPGDICELTGLSGASYVLARVVYCERLANRNYCIGLELQESQQNWWHGTHATTAAPLESSSRGELNVAS